MAFSSCIDGGYRAFDAALIAARLAEIEAAGGIGIFVQPGEAALLEFSDPLHALYGWALYLPPNALAADEPGAIAFIRPTNLTLPESPEIVAVGVLARVGLVNPLSEQDVPLVAPATVTAPLRRGEGATELAQAQNDFAVVGQYNGTAFRQVPAVQFIVDPERLSAQQYEFFGAAFAGRPATTPPTLAQMLPTFPGGVSACTLSLPAGAADVGVFVDAGVVVLRDTSGMVVGLALDLEETDGLYDWRSDVKTDSRGVQSVTQGFGYGEVVFETAFAYNFDDVLRTSQSVIHDEFIWRDGSYTNPAASLVTKTVNLYDEEPQIVVTDQYGFAASGQVNYRNTVTATATQRGQTWLFRNDAGAITGVTVRRHSPALTDTVHYAFSRQATGDVVEVHADFEFSGPDAVAFAAQTRELPVPSGCRDEDLMAVFADYVNATPLGRSEFMPLNYLPSHDVADE